MSNDLTNNKAHGLHASITDYASEVFEESSVCAVSAILTNDSKPRKTFRSVVFVIFTILFLYQCIACLYYVLQHPYVAEIEILRPETFVSPAYTFCNSNPVKRSKFCTKYPGNCTKPDEELCEKYPRFCGTPNTQILKEEDIGIYDFEELFHLSHEAGDMVSLDDGEEDNPVGPLPRSNPHEYDISACFTYFDRVDSPQGPRTKKRTPLGTGISETLTFDPQENELIYPEAQAGIMFEVHSPFEAVNPFDTGYFMKPGHFYRIKIKMTQEELQTECVNYTEVWLKNNKTGYRSQDACEQKCIGDIVMKCLNCTEPYVLYPYPNENFCKEKNEGKIEVCKDPEHMIAECIKGCKDDCVKTKFSYEIKQSFLNRHTLNADKNESREIRVRIDFSDVDIQKTTHKPQFKVFEIFSLIGGFLAFWIGLSMVQVVEIFDCLFQIVKHLFIKRAARSEGSVA